jgi:hypothetical protein
MRRRIEVFQGFVSTSFFLLDPLFSSLPLPPAARGKAHGAWRIVHSVFCFAPCALRFAHNPPQKLLIKTTDYTDYFKFFLSVNSVTSVAKKINDKEDQHVSITGKCLILAFKSSGTRPKRRKVHGLNGTIVFKTVSGNGYGQRFIYYQKINGYTSFSTPF